MKSIIFGLMGFLAFKLYGLFFIEPITGSDATRYFALTQNFNSLNSFYQFAMNEIQSFGLFSISSITFYGLFYMPFYQLFSLSNPNSIVIFNSIIVISLIFIWVKVFSEFQPNNLMAKQKRTFISVLVFFLLLSPSLSYWSSVFLKDVFSLFLGILTFYFFNKRKYILFLLFLILAIAIRPYALGFIFCFWAIFHTRLKLAFVLAGISSLYVIHEAGFIGVFNIIPMMFRILFSPNPLNIDNWNSFFLPTFEGFIILIGLCVVFISFLQRKELRKVYIVFLTTLFIYASILTLVGQASIVHQGLDYGLLSAGDDMFRKKLPFVMIIYTVIAYAFATIKTDKNRHQVYTQFRRYSDESKIL